MAEVKGSIPLDSTLEVLGNHMRVLILDDDDMRHRKFAHWFAGYDVVHVHTVDEFRNALNSPKFDYIFLDHDLNDQQYVSAGVIKVGAGDLGGPTREMTGMDAAKFLVDNQDKMPAIQTVVHSWNPAGAMNMVKLLGDNGFHVVRWEFNPKDFLKLQ